MSNNEVRAILNNALHRVEGSTSVSVLADPEIIARVEIVARNLQNRAAVRLVLSCVLAKVHRPNVDIVC